MFARTLLAVFAVSTFVAACTPAKPAKNSAPPPTGALNVVSEKADGLGEPEVVYENPTDKAMAVDFVGPAKAHLDVAPGETKSIKLAAGTYQATIGGDDLLPTTDTVTFANDYRYRMSLKIVLEVDDPNFAGKGLDCFEIQVTPKFQNCARTTANCESLRKRAPADLTTSECAHHAEMFHFRATPEGGKVRILFFPTQAACDAVLVEWGKQFPKDTTTACSKIQ